MKRTTVKLSRWVGLLAAAACVLALPAWGDPLVATKYAKPSQTFKVCLLLLQSQTAPGQPGVTFWNPDPWILPVLNRSPFKPTGWTLENPLAPGMLIRDNALIVSGNYYSIMKGGGYNQSLESFPGAGNPADPTQAYPTSWYTNGKKVADAVDHPISKDDPAYWIVKLDDKSIDALADFDLIILNGHDTCTLTNLENNYLRYLLERGVTIWINNSQRNGNQVKNFFLDPTVLFQIGPYNNDNTTKLSKADPQHWLLNAYYQLSDYEVGFLRDNTSSSSYIVRGIAGYPGGENSLLSEVVRLIPALQTNNPVYPDYTWSLNYAPAIAAGRVGNGYVIITATDQAGAISDWWENKHNKSFNWATSTFAFNDLTTWPATTDMGKGNIPNKHYTYIASSKFLYNMLGRPANYRMVSGNPAATRTYDAQFASSLSRAWGTEFNTLSDPVSSGNYVALTGNKLDPLHGSIWLNPDPQPNEYSQNKLYATSLRVYRTRRMADDGGQVLDYPYGLYEEHHKLVTPRLIDPVSGVRPPAWNAFYPNDATADSQMDLCFDKYLYSDKTATTQGTVNGYWVGSPVFGQITQVIKNVEISPGVFRDEPTTRNVLYALQATPDGAGSWIYRPRCFLLDPYISTNYVDSAGDAVKQVGDDLWSTVAANKIEFTATGFGQPLASMTLSNS
ncbi:MAG TPA: hypothetical protein VGM23_01440, partial [Armatimonadota bacterium]